MKNISIKIPSIRENVRMVEKFIEDAKSRYDIGEDVYGNMVVAITESVSNAIVHGNQLDENKLVGLVFTMAESKIQVEIEDEGTGYDFDNVPDPTAPENLAKPGGRGLFLMKHLADQIEFIDNGQKVRMVFNV